MKNTQKIRTVYVTQHGDFWKLTPEQWREACFEGMCNGGYRLPRSTALARRPQTVHSSGETHESKNTSFWTADSTLLVYQTLNWGPENFREALRELDQLEGNTQPSLMVR